MFYEHESRDRSGRAARGDCAAGFGDGGGNGATGADRARGGGLRCLRSSGHRERAKSSRTDARRSGDATHRGRRKKGAPLRMCACGRKKENRGPKARRLMSAVGAVVFMRRYWKCTCGSDGSYAADELLGVAGQRYTKTVQKHCCRLAAETSFASTSKLLHDLLGADLCPETVRTMVEGHGKGMARFQAEDTASAQAFQQAAGADEFTTDAGKVHTREQG